MSDKLYFSVKDLVSGEQASPDNISLPLLQELTESMSRFIRGNSTKTNLNDISIAVKSGSFALVANTSPLVSDAIRDYRVVKDTGSLDDIDPIRAKVLRDLQEKAKKNSNRIYTISDSGTPDKEHEISFSNKTDYKTSRTDQWAKTEIFMYGKVVDMGGKTKANVHIVLDNNDTIVLDADSQKIAEDDENRLYKDQLVKVSAEQNLETKKLRNESLMEFVKYNPHFDEDEFNRISKEVEHSWADVPDIVTWVEETRGNCAQIS
ncbi:hypothetical protein IKD67_02445 [Candidatus Saccharibacteria bacterium]|nr:hypothetical protein [Candidatus Saccharibacteria bacterium]